MDDDAIIHAMQVFGGSFIRRLADCYQVADDENRARLKTAFSDLWEKYEDLAALRKEPSHAEARTET